ncbi:MAG: hypothetical protein WBC05_04720 [Sedimentisphaerales bacterium]
MSKLPINREYPVGPEEIQKILKDQADRSGFNIMFSKGSNAVIHMHLYQEIGDNMGDTYEAGQVGAQGPHAHAHDMTFNQLWNNCQKDVNLQVLANELELIRKKIASQAGDSAEAAVAGGEIAKAELAAKKDDGPSVMQHLKSAGNWALDFATSVGSSLVAEVIKKSMDM